MRFISERPYLISLMLIVLVALWMLMPMPEADDTDLGPEQTKQLQKVQVRNFSAQPTELELVFTGRTEPNLKGEIASELDGILLSFAAKRGAMIKKGDPIAQIDVGSVEAALKGARAEENSAQLTYRAQAKLLKQGVNTKNDKAMAYAALLAATAQVEQYEKELSKSAVLAPFDGMLADHHAEIGDFMQVGRPIATLIDLDPVRAVGDVAERNVAEIKLGGKASVTMLNGDRIEGEITYISPFADETTRTFRVEVTLPNSDGKLVAGMTTQMKILLRTESAYKISPSLLALNAEGDIQVATVGDDNKVALYDVDLVRSETDGIWVSGIPDNARIITLGQGFVHHGDLVDPVDEAQSKTAAVSE